MKTQGIELKDFAILVVDDNYNNILLIRMLLEEHGITQIFEAKSAREAFEIINVNEIDAILMDVMMPEIDGITACKTLRQEKQYDLIPIIMVTANDDNETLTKSFEAGADDFISKPVNETILVTRLQSQLSRISLQKEILQRSRFSAMDEMISMLAHQWRQPLSLINSVSNTLRTKAMLDSLNNDDVNSGLESIEGYVTELSELISSFKANFSSSVVECTTINSVFEEAIRSVDNLLSPTLISVEAIETTLQVSIQRKGLIRIVINILTNAIEALIRDNIEEVPNIRLECIEEDKKFTLVISDNANGIKDEDLGHIYEPYFSTKEEKNGVGLGLFYVKTQLDNELKGSIKVQRVDNTTQFRVTLPKELC